MLQKPHVLLVEDEPSIADNIRYALKTEGLSCSWTSLGHEAIEHLQALHPPPQLVILDVGLPDMSGFEVCKQIRQFSDIPIIFLTARGDEIDRVVGLEIGGDDYVVKPFSPRELVARVKAILRRIPQPENALSSPLSNQRSTDDTCLFQVDEEKRQIHFDHQCLELTSYEYGLLLTLIKQPERVFTRNQLLDAVWPSPNECFDRVVDTHIKTLRAKLRQVNTKLDPVKTHRGVGYSLSTQRAT